MNATFDGARIHQQELDREIESLRTERFLNAQDAEPARARWPAASHRWGGG
jgi:hypothetical protein